MNTYPAIPPTLESAEKRQTGRQLDRATNGVPKVRSFFTTQKKNFTIVHQATDAQKATLEAFVNANALVPFLFQWAADGVTYTCLFAADEPQYVPFFFGLWKITVQLVEA